MITTLRTLIDELDAERAEERRKWATAATGVITVAERERHTARIHNLSIALAVLRAKLEERTGGR